MKRSPETADRSIREMSTMSSRAYWDAPFFAGLLMAVCWVGALGCFGVAATQLHRAPDAEILTTDNAPLPERF